MITCLSGPADYPARLARAATFLADIEPDLASVAERIGMQVMPTARQVLEASGAPAAVAEEFDARTGWRDEQDAAPPDDGAHVRRQ